MKGGHKEGTRNNNEESPLCYIDGHPPHSEVRVHPGECSKEQSQELNYFCASCICTYPSKLRADMAITKIVIGTAITKAFFLIIIFLSLLVDKWFRSLTKLLTIDINRNFEQDAVYWIHLSTAQDAGLEFRQTGSNAIITYQSVPKECVVKVVSESGKQELFARERTPREGQKVSLGDTGVHTSSDVLCQPLETGSNMQMWDPNPIRSESRSWSDEECEHSVDVRVNGISNDEIYKDNQYMQRIAEQVQKLVHTEILFYKKKTHLGTIF